MLKYACSMSEGIGTKQMKQKKISARLDVTSLIWEPGVLGRVRGMGVAVKASTPVSASYKPYIWFRPVPDDPE